MDKERSQFEVGRVVLSRAGRDKGVYFLVLESEGGFSMIADGKTRKLARPKKKKQKHLKPCPDILEAIAEKLRSGARVFDSEVYSGLKKYNKPEPEAKKPLDVSGDGKKRRNEEAAGGGAKKPKGRKKAGANGKER